MTLYHYLNLTKFYNPIQIYNILADCKPFFYYPMEQAELLKRLETSEEYLKDFEVQNAIEYENIVKIYV